MFLTIHQLQSSLGSTRDHQNITSQKILKLDLINVSIQDSNGPNFIPPRYSAVLHRARKQLFEQLDYEWQNPFSFKWVHQQIKLQILGHWESDKITTASVASPKMQSGAVLWLKELLAPISLKMWKVRQKEAMGLCRTMLVNFLWPAVKDNQEVWFQQDGITVYIARMLNEPSARNFQWTNHF